MTLELSPQLLLGRRYLKSFASGIAFQFAASAQHYAWQSYAHRLPHVVIDLLEPMIEPVLFDVERNRILAGMCRYTLQQNIKRLKPPGAVIAATLTADFGIDDYREDELCSTVGASIYTVTLVDDRGKPWTCSSHWDRVMVDLKLSLLDRRRRGAGFHNEVP